MDASYRHIKTNAGYICVTINSVTELRTYVDRLGRSPFDRWYEKHEDSTRARIAIALNRLSQGGAAAKGVGLGVLELRLDFGSG